MEKDGKSNGKVILVSREYRNKNSNEYTHIFRVDLFNSNNIYVSRCRGHTKNKYGD